MSETVDEVAVLGAGIVGICCALSLAERGMKVRLIDRDAPGQATSYGNAGVVSPSSFIPLPMPGLLPKLPKLMFGPFRPLAVRPAFWPRMLGWGMKFLANGTEAQMRRGADAMEILCAPSIDLYRRHLHGTGHEDLLRDSIYIHAFRNADPQILQALDYRIRQEKGIDLELVGGDRLRQIEPALSDVFKSAVLLHGQGRLLSPGRAGRVLAEKATKMGVRIARQEVTSLRRDGEAWTVATKGAAYRAGRIVMAMGVWSRDMLRPLGIDMPLVAERGYHLEFPDPGVRLENSVMDADAKIACSSMEGGLRMAGQAEFGAIDAPPDSRVHKRMLGIAREIFPGMSAEQPRLWMGRRPTLPDGLAAIGPVPGHEGLYAAFGHSHTGLMMAPKTGEVIAELMQGKAPNANLSAFAPLRFSSRG